METSGLMAAIPTSVRTSVWLLSATYVAGFAAALTAILFAALLLFIVQSVSRGKNWSRLAVAGLVLLEAFYALQLPGNFAGPSPVPTLEVILWLIQCVAATLLFLPASNQWYRSFHVRRGVS
jgi:hypothetical protein